MLDNWRTRKDPVRNRRSEPVLWLITSLVVLSCLTLPAACSAATPPGYNDHDYQILRTFLELSDGSGTNGDKISTGYDPDNPSTWGVIWSEATPREVTKIMWSGKDLIGILDVSGCLALTHLECDFNQLTGLDVSGCTQLLLLRCYNNQLPSLNVSGCAQLVRLDCYSNQLISLDVSSCTQLAHLDCSDNQLSNLDVSGCTQLAHLDCYSNQLTSLDVNGCTQLAHLNCSDNQLTSLGAGSLEALERLYCSYNRLTNLNVSDCAGLELLYCYNNELSGLDVSGCTQLAFVYCGSNRLTNLDASNCVQLQLLHCYNNELSSLDVSGCTQLEELYCADNLLASLDVGSCEALKKLYCSYNRLTSLDASNCAGLEKLDCDENRLTGLNVGGCTELMYLSCRTNRLTFADLPLNLPVSGGAYAYNPQAEIQIGSGGIVMTGEEIDLSAQAEVNGVDTVFTWYDGEDTEITPTTADGGKFTFDPTFAGRTIYCAMTNAAFPDLTLKTTSAQVDTTHQITFIKPTDANDESNPVSISSGSLVIAQIDGDTNAVSGVTVSIDGGEKQDVVPSGNTVYYLLPAGLESGEHTVTIELTTTGEQKVSGEVTFHWDSYRRGFGFGRFDFGDVDTH